MQFGVFMSGVELFDMEVFSIMRTEALTMDPQQRLLLQTCWEALPNGPSAVQGRHSGAFVGIAATDYDSLAHRNGVPISSYSFTAGAPSVASGRITYVFGMRGPAVSVDTACSASLVATHMACTGFRYVNCVFSPAFERFSLSQK